MNDLKHVQLPSAWDAGELSRISLKDGTTYEQLIGDIDAALAATSQRLRSGGFAGLIHITEQAGLEYRTGSSGGFEAATEYAQPDAKRAATTGHMLPLSILDRKLGWTYLFLLNARRRQLDADIAGLINDVHDAWDQALLTRLFSGLELSGPGYGLGESGVSAPFCDGGAGTLSYVPPPVPSRGGTFAASHNHYLRLDGINQTNLDVAARHLWEHGHDGPFELLVALDDLATWSNTSSVEGYTERADPLVRYGQDSDLAQVDDDYVGGVRTRYGFCRLRASGRIPAGYWALTRAYGPDDPRNPLYVRIDPQFGFGVRLVTRNVGQYPLEAAVGLMMFGVGVGEDRTAAVCVLNDTSGSYSTPVIG